jgi:hypothetical protein
VLVEVRGAAPISWAGKVVPVEEAGPLCTQRPDHLTVWAPGASLARAFHLLAMCKSAAPERCLVLTDAQTPLERVPGDTWIAVVAGGGWAQAHRGLAAYECADLRSDRIFRLLLSGRVRRRPELRPLFDSHALLATAHGGRILERWERVVQVLFAGGLDRRMDDELRASLEELADAARDADHAVTGGFHTLDTLVRGPADWADGARRYLPLAAARSREVLAMVHQWLQFTGAWHRACGATANEYREKAATVLHRLADDPWLSGHGVEHLLGTIAAA